MNIKDLLSPVKVTPILLPGMQAADQLGASIISFHKLGIKSFPKSRMAIVGIPDAINSSYNQGCSESSLWVRNYLYGLRNLEFKGSILDMGDIKGKSSRDKYVALIEVVKELNSHNIPFLVVGGSQDYTIPLLKSLKTNQPLTISIVDSFINYSEDLTDYPSNNYLNQVFSIDSSLNINLLAYQQYLVSQTQTKWLEKNNIETERLRNYIDGKIINIEPIIRDSEIVSFDISAIKTSDMPGQKFPMPNGLSGKDACQIAWYSGMSDKLKCFAIFELNSETDSSKCSVMQVAQMAWHFFEGIIYRDGDYPLRSIDSYQTFHLPLDDYNICLRFFLNTENQRWWIEIPFQDKEVIFSCNKSDYEAIKSGEIGGRWLKYILKPEMKRNCENSCQ